MYERLQIESLLQPQEIVPERGTGLYLMPVAKYARRVGEEAVIPALLENGINISMRIVVFDSTSDLRRASENLRSAEVIVAELTTFDAALYYNLGLAHGPGRCPIIVAQRPFELPFNLSALRWVEYDDTHDGRAHLREHLSRAIRVFLAAERGPEPPPAPPPAAPG